MEYSHASFLTIAHNLSKNSPCNRLKVGCVLVKNNRIISQGYNDFLPDCSKSSIVRDGHEQAIVHAEQNAVGFCCKFGKECDNCIAYITHYPCINCCKILLASGIKKIIYSLDYNNDELVSILCKQKSVPIEKQLIVFNTK